MKLNITLFKSHVQYNEYIENIKFNNVSYCDNENEVHYYIKIDFSKRYLTIVSLEDNNTIGWKAADSSTIKTISISTDEGTTWTEKTSSTSGTTLATLSSGQKMLVKGSNTAYGGTSSRYNYFTSTGNFNVEGNIMSLIYGDNFIGQTTLDSVGNNFKYLFNNCIKLIFVNNLIIPATTLANSCYRNMFEGCTSLTNAPELPATILANYCYDNMFRGCTSLTSAPELPATTLTDWCYQCMFYGCISLTKAPDLPVTTLAHGCCQNMFRGCTLLTEASELPATTLATYCYYGMFAGCTSLTTAPELPATTLVSYCYYSMFDSCTSLNYIKCLATDISASNCTKNWVTNITGIGTFIKANGMTWITGVNGIPSRWTVQTASA